MAGGEDGSAPARCVGNGAVGGGYGSGWETNWPQGRGDVWGDEAGAILAVRRLRRRGTRGRSGGNDELAATVKRVVGGTAEVEDRSSGASPSSSQVAAAMARRWTKAR